MFNFIKESTNTKTDNKKDIIISRRIEKDKEMEVNGNDNFNYKAAEQKENEFLREGAWDESDYNEIKQI